MTRSARLLGALAAVSLLAAGGASLAATPVVTDEMLAPLVSAYVRAVKPGEEAELHRDLFGAVLRRVHRSHALEVDVPALVGVALKVITPLEPHSGEPAQVFSKAVNAALATLDPHSRYLDPRAHGNLRSSITGAFGGLGLQVDMHDGLVRVVAPIPDTPAARAGLQSGDLIVRFDEQEVQGMTLTDAILRMRGEPGTPISLLIRRAGLGAEFTVALVRETIRSPALRWSMEGDVLVLRLTRFTASVAALLEQAIADATAKRAPRAVVLDMRGNGGGLLREAILAADVFLNSGTIATVRRRGTGGGRSWIADANEQLPGVPMVVLIDGRSASAAELVAAALQENGRATVMGERSFGKGSVQALVSLGADKGALRLTTAIYHGPSGRTVQGTGVGPDIELVAAPRAPAPAPAPAARREADRPHALPGTHAPLPPSARVEQSRCAAPQAKLDPALACALAFLRGDGIDSFLAALEPEESSSAH